MNSEFLTWCDAQIAACKARQKALAADGRGDEATLEQIRSNVYGIFRSVFTALNGDRDLVLDRLNRLPATWQQQLALAKQHGDDNAAHIERIKLETAARIRRQVENLEVPHD